jgi:hypothetical protein
MFVDSRILSHSARLLLPSSKMQACVFLLRKPFLSKIIIILSVWSDQQRHLPFVTALHKFNTEITDAGTLMADAP